MNSLYVYVKYENKVWEDMYQTYNNSASGKGGKGKGERVRTVEQLAFS